MAVKSNREKTIAKRVVEDKAKLIEQFKVMPVIQQAVRSAGLGRTTYYDWRKKDAKFAKAADEAIKEGVTFMCEIAETQLLSLIKEKKIEAIRFFLSHRHPAYANRLEIKGSITHEKKPLSSEQKKLVRKALRLASLKKNYGSKEKRN